MAQDPRKSELIAELARSRQAVSASMGGVRRGLDVPQRLGASFARNKVAWLTGASLLGFVFSRLPARTKKVVIDRKGRPATPATDQVVKAGVLVTLAKFGFDLARPALTKWLIQRATEYAQQRFAAPPGSRRTP